MRPVYLFDDGLPLGPLTDLRPAFDVRTGALTACHRVELGWGRPIAGLLVPQHLEALTRELHPGIAVNDFDDGAEEAVLLNGRWVDCQLTEEMSDLEPYSAVVTRDLGVLAACGPVRDFPRLAREDSDGYRQIAHEPPTNGAQVVRTLSRPWHTRTFRDQAIHCDLRLMIGRRLSRAPRPREIHIDPAAKVHPAAIIDDEHGDVLIDAHATIRPGAIILGPAYIGPHTVVLERATVRPNTAIGPWCKINGEVSGTIFQGYSNKAHDGFLGDSWVGEWVNLGAGTTNSNLLNTYSEIFACARPGGSSEHTGEQFLGAIIGDHVKTAICTRIMTGAVINTGAMLAASAPVSGCIPPFAWMTDEALRTYRLPRFREAIRLVMARRNIEPTEAYMQRIEALHAQAAKAAHP